jgi:hypothetical protein
VRWLSFIDHSSTAESARCFISSRTATDDDESKERIESWIRSGV